MLRSILVNILCILFLCCQEKVSNEKVRTYDPKNKVKPTSTLIKVSEAVRTDFPIRKILNGKVNSGKKAILRFENGGLITSLPYDNGSYVKAGYPIAKLEDVDLQNDLAKNKIELKKANFEKNKWIIGDGGEANDDTSIPKDKLKTIETITGVDAAHQNIKESQHRISKKKIRAPFSGIIADMKVEKYEVVSPGQECCTFVSANSFEAIFYVVEGEVLNLTKGQQIRIHPMMDENKKVTGSIHRINPMVNQYGLVEVRAKLQNPPYNLLDGMNVKVYLEKVIPHQLIVPKESLVTRSGKPVIFTLDKKEGRAKWNYVSIKYENDTHLAISDGLQEGDLIIIHGNLNLDHDARVHLEQGGEIAPKRENTSIASNTRVGATIQLKNGTSKGNKRYEYTRFVDEATIKMQIEERGDLILNNILALNKVNSISSLKKGSIIKIKSL